MKLYVMRHGETDWNKQALLQGNTDIPLNENGRKLADLSGRNMTRIPFDVCFSSPLSRASETAGLILQYNPGYRERFEALGYAPSIISHGCPVTTDERIVEIRLGPWEGHPGFGPACRLPGGSFSFYWEDFSGEQLPEGVEAPAKAAERAGAFLRDLASRPELKDKTVLVTVHGGLMKCLLLSLNDKDAADGKIPFNCEAVKLETDADGSLRVVGRELFYDPDLAMDYYHAADKY